MINCINIFIIIFCLAIIFTLIYTLCIKSSSKYSPSSHPEVNFLIMGDWGGKPDKPYTTEEQIITAQGMEKIGGKINAKFALALGDNFYFKGVSDVNDPRFQNTFENVFTGYLKSPGFVFHVLAGNHDHLGNVNAQIEYSNKSKRWSFPSLWYTWKEGPIQFIFLDTVTLTGSLYGNELPGPKNILKFKSQLEWLEDTLSKSTAEFIIVAGHHNIYGVCTHNSNKILINTIKPLLEKYNVSMWVNGHDHCGLYINVGDGIQYHTVGSAHKNNSSIKYLKTIPNKKNLIWKIKKGVKGGFAAVRVKNNKLQLTHHAGDGTILYTAPKIYPRKRINLR